MIRQTIQVLHIVQSSFDELWMIADRKRFKHVQIRCYCWWDTILCHFHESTLDTTDASEFCVDPDHRIIEIDCWFYFQIFFHVIGTICITVPYIRGMSHP